MCGLTGFLALGFPRRGDNPQAALRRMNDAIRHRGPDSEGYWTDAEAGVALAHRRLAIVDLSPAGSQPMTSPSGRYVIVFNGEIYNHQDLRAEREAAVGHLPWRGHSDTETLLAGFDLWGLEGTVRRAIGMFAFAVWDRRERTLVLARDRLGEKPLYFSWQGGRRVFLFGSELKALRAHPAFDATIDREALRRFMRHSYIGGDASIYRGVRKTPPGCLVFVSASSPDPKIVRYWDPATVAAGDTAQRQDEIDPQEAVDALEALLADAVKRQMIADVPLGAFLSGGVDSTTIVALMQKQSSQPVKTFTIGTYDERFNEAEQAKHVSDYLGTDHTELYVSVDDLLSVVPDLPRIYDEPLGDSSQIPTILVSRLARQCVTVSLSGDGGDELFCGYDRYRQAAAFWRWLSRVPRAARRAAAAGVQAVPPPVWDAAARSFRGSSESFGQRAHRVADYARSRSVMDLYRRMLSHWDDGALVLDVVEPALGADDPDGVSRGLGDIERMMAEDMSTYLPDDVLAKVDRASMSVSLESRAPLLDHRVVEFAWRLPLHCKLRDGQSKWVLREVLRRHVPPRVAELPKKGFSVPIADWLRGPLRNWGEALLDPARLKQEGFLNSDLVQRKWREHLSGRFDCRIFLWNVLTFQAWLEAEADLSTSARRTVNGKLAAE